MKCLFQISSNFEMITDFNHTLNSEMWILTLTINLKLQVPVWFYSICCTVLSTFNMVHQLTRLFYTIVYALWSESFKTSKRTNNIR